MKGTSIQHGVGRRSGQRADSERRGVRTRRRDHRFDTEAEGIAAANDTEFGLAAYIFTRDLDRALRVSDALESGMIGVNRGVISDAAAPFGGVKESGFGREGGTEGIEEYLNTKYIALES